MAWEWRGARRYYYAARREGRRVVKTCLGSGALGAMAAERDSQARGERERQRKESAGELGRLLEPLDAAHLEAERLDRLLSSKVAVALAARGYHLHRGQWRRRRA